MLAADGIYSLTALFYLASVIPLMTGRPFILVTFLLATSSSFYGHSADGSDYISFPPWYADDGLAVTFSALATAGPCLRIQPSADGSYGFSLASVFR